VKTILLTSALAAALLAGSAEAQPPQTSERPATQSAADAAGEGADAAEPQEAEPAPKPPSEMAQAFLALQKELKPYSTKITGDMLALLETMEAHDYPPESRERFAKVFGDPDAFKLRRESSGAYKIGMKAHSFTEADETRYNWSDLGLTIAIDKTGRQLRMNGQWDTLAIEAADTSVTASGMTLAGQSRRSPNDIWLGASNAGVDQISVTGKSGVVTMENLKVSTEISPRAKIADIGYDFRIGAIKFGSEKIDGVRMALRINAIDIKALEALAGDMDIDEQKPAKKFEVMLPQLRKIANTFVRNGGSIDIQEISVGYKGSRAVFKGRVAMPGAKEYDLDVLMGAYLKIQANFEARVPVSLVREVTLAILRNQAKKKDEEEGAIDPALISLGVAEVFVAKAVSDGYARLDKGVLVSKIAFRNGKLSVNGKPVRLPSASQFAPAAQRPAPPRAVAQASTRLQAREISAGCGRAALPPEAAAKGDSLSTAVEVAVGVDGKVSDVRVLTSSGSRAFDAAVLQSAAGCRWTPALDDGEEVAVKVGQQHLATPLAPQAVVTTIAR
jgi:TonB family protein